MGATCASVRVKRLGTRWEEGRGPGSPGMSAPPPAPLLISPPAPNPQVHRVLRRPARRAPRARRAARGGGGLPALPAGGQGRDVAGDVGRPGPAQQGDRPGQVRACLCVWTREGVCLSSMRVSVADGCGGRGSISPQATFKPQQPPAPKAFGYHLQPHHPAESPARHPPASPAHHPGTRSWSSTPTPAPRWPSAASSARRARPRCSLHSSRPPQP